jgi:hypothetical protein
VAIDDLSGVGSEHLTRARPGHPGLLHAGNFDISATESFYCQTGATMSTMEI